MGMRKQRSTTEPQQTKYTTTFETCAAYTPTVRIEVNRPQCYCPAYPGPHEPGVGDCSATGDALCPACAVILADDDVVHRCVASATRREPAEYVVILLQPCGNCGAVGEV